MCVCRSAPWNTWNTVRGRGRPRSLRGKRRRKSLTGLILWTHRVLPRHSPRRRRQTQNCFPELLPCVCPLRCSILKQPMTDNFRVTRTAFPLRLPVMARFAFCTFVSRPTSYQMLPHVGIRRHALPLARLLGKKMVIDRSDRLVSEKRMETKRHRCASQLGNVWPVQQTRRASERKERVRRGGHHQAA